MTAGNNGSGTPDNDDPFAYLYRSEDGTGGGASGTATQQPGVPRTSYNQVRPVGERRYGGQQARQPQQPPQPPGHPSTHYAAPETVPGGRAAVRQGAPAGRGRAAARGGRNHKGLLIGAIAVVAAVVIGVGSAIFFSSGDDAPGNQAGGSPAPTAEAGGGGNADGDGGQDKDKDEDAEKTGSLPKEDAASLRPEGGATVAKEIQGSRARSGAYVAGLDKPGASVNWVFDVPEGGKYTLFVGYGVPGKDANSTLTVNGKPQGQPLNMQNFARAEEGQWDKGWTRTFAWIELNKGTNTVSISCEEGNQCGFVLDQVWLKEGHVKS
ncbi:CBM35 domain-containing protein [Streptomyces glaucosporus]|uniref:CBM35 domain-containing protein n=1 Tax=Streptomyces glaucosporus TaxID=284044 RepID=A0ABP5USA3_9ACTN